MVPFQADGAGPSARRGRGRRGQHIHQEALDRSDVGQYGLQVADRLLGVVASLTAEPSGRGGWGRGRGRGGGQGGRGGQGGPGGARYTPY